MSKKTRDRQMSMGEMESLLEDVLAENASLHKRLADLGEETPEVDPELRQKLEKLAYRKQYLKSLRTTVYALIVVAAVAILLATLFLPIFRIYGTSMTPTLKEGEVIMAIRTNNYKQGDLVAFYYNNKILVKRVIASSGDWVDIDEVGNVYVNGEYLDEPYLTEKHFGICDLELPYQVPESRWFVMGDHRETSVDSRTSDVGCVSDEQITGRLLMKVWPLFGDD